jgi:hypothetical protein
MIPFETIVWDVLLEHTPDRNEGQRLVQRMKATGAYNLAHGEYEADHDVHKCQSLLRDAMKDALHDWKKNHEK